jgi:hypothetical protein
MSIPVQMRAHGNTRHGANAEETVLTAAVVGVGMEKLLSRPDDYATFNSYPTADVPSPFPDLQV